MPADTAAAPSVTDPDLVRLAIAGPNWICSYCGSDQRRTDGTCRQCGAWPEEPAQEVRPAMSAADASHVLSRRLLRWRRPQKIAAGIAGVIVTIVLVMTWLRRERTYTASVAEARWHHAIAVDRYAIWQRAGWQDSAPAGAFEVVSRGQQIHHYVDVLDGYDTEHYTERVECGEDCRDVPETCSETCSDNGNGFATCRTVCSGGGRTCTTRYCDEQRSRQVPRYRKEPRYAEAISYKLWDWNEHRVVTASGTGTTGLSWPTEQARIGQGLADGEKERERRSASYRVRLAYNDGEHLTFAVDATEFASFAVGSTHELRVKGDRVVVDGKIVQRE